MKKIKSRHPDMTKNKQIEDDVLTMDGNSNYSRPGYGAFSMKKPKKSFNVKPGKFGRKGSILDDFEAVANQSQEEILGGRSSPKRGSMEVSPRKSKLELGVLNGSAWKNKPNGAESVKASYRKSAPLVKADMSMSNANKTPKSRTSKSPLKTPMGNDNRSYKSPLADDPRRSSSVLTGKGKFKPMINGGPRASPLKPMPDPNFR